MDSKKLGDLVRLLHINHNEEERICALVERPDLWDIYVETLADYDVVDCFALSEIIQDIINYCEMSNSFVISSVSAIIGKNMENEYSAFRSYILMAHADHVAMASKSPIEYL